MRPQRRGMNLSADIREQIISGALPPTIDQIKSMYGPAQTMFSASKKGESVALAMDHGLETGGAYSLLQHSFAMGQGVGPGPAFVGYAALSSMSQNGLIRACIETVADDMTREWIDIETADTDGDGDNSDDRKALEDALIDFGIRDTFHRAAELNGYFGGCLIYIDTGRKGEDLLNPLDVSEKSAEMKDLKRFTVIEPINVFPGIYESTNPLDPGYFNPDTWWVLGKQVHKSRLIRICGDEVPVLLKPAYNFLGLPKAQVLWDYVIHFQDARAAATRLLDKFSMTVFKTDMQDLLFNQGATAQLDSRIGLMVDNRSNDGILALDMESEDIVNVVTPLGGVTDIVRQQLEFVVAINRTPAVKTMGISPSGFNTGESDLTNYNDHINTEQEKVFRKGLQRAIDIIQIHTTGQLDKSVTFTFRSLNEDDDNARANTQKTKADGDTAYIVNGVLSPEEVRQKVAADPDSGYGFIDVSDLPEPPTDNSLYENIEGGEGDSGERGNSEGV